MFNIQKICPQIFEDDSTQQESLEQEGKILSFDTRDILNNVDLESLNQDEIVEIK